MYGIDGKSMKDKANINTPASPIALEIIPKIPSILPTFSTLFFDSFNPALELFVLDKIPKINPTI